MEYNGFELTEFTSDGPVVFNPPRKMFVWDIVDREPRVRTVVAYLPGRSWHRVVGMSADYSSCAEIPGSPFDGRRRATNRELVRWLAQGNGERVFVCDSWNADLPVSECVHVRKWDDKEWHEPTADYMGLEG